MGRIIPLTAKSINGQNLKNPRVVYVNEDLITVEPGKDSASYTKVIESSAIAGNDKTTYLVYEKAIHIETARNPSTTDIYLKKYVFTALAGVGSVQGGAQPLNGYLHEALTLGAGATDAFLLPAATPGKIVVVINNDVSGDNAEVFPAVGDFINQLAVNVGLNVAAGTRRHFVCEVADYWKVAEDAGA